MSLSFVNFTTADRERFAEARAIRTTVFIEEQQVPPADEWDAFEDDATHVLMYVDGVAMGTARLRILGEAAKLERIAIRREGRGKGYGEAITQHLLHLAAAQPGVLQAKLSAQTHAIGFYEKQGFTVCSEAYMDAGIPHRMMAQPLTKN